MLVIVAACSMFLAATTGSTALLYVFALAFLALCGYVYLLAQLRQRERVDGESSPQYKPQYQPQYVNQQSGSAIQVVRALLSAARLFSSHGAIAQLVERDNRTVEAKGSIPFSSTPKPQIRSDLRLFAPGSPARRSSDQRSA